MMQTVVIILFATSVSAQNQNVVISARNIPVRTALTQIRQATNVHFVYEEKASIVSRPLLSITRKEHH